MGWSISAYAFEPFGFSFIVSCQLLFFISFSNTLVNFYLDLQEFPVWILESRDWSLVTFRHCCYLLPVCLCLVHGIICWTEILKIVVIKYIKFLPRLLCFFQFCTRSPLTSSGHKLFSDILSYCVILYVIFRSLYHPELTLEHSHRKGPDIFFSSFPNTTYLTNLLFFTYLWCHFVIYYFPIYIYITLSLSKDLVIFIVLFQLFN